MRYWTSSYNCHRLGLGVATASVEWDTTQTGPRGPGYKAGFNCSFTLRKNTEGLDEAKRHVLEAARKQLMNVLETINEELSQPEAPRAEGT